MQAVISCDFLLSPAFCEPENIEYQVRSLVELSRSLAALDQNPLLECDATGKLSEAGKYPCEGLFKNNLSKLDQPVYTGKDVSRIVNQILAAGEEFCYDYERLWECEDKEFKPKFVNIHPARTGELEEVVEAISVCKEIEERSLSLLHYCSINSFPTINFSATLTATEPDIDNVLPHSFSQTTNLYADCRQYLSCLHYEELLSADPENPDLLKQALFWGALHWLRSKGLPLNSIDSDRFAVGDEFVSSLGRNQCLIGQKFGRVCMDSMIAVVTNDPDYEIHPFTKLEKRDEQRTYGRFKAFRSHVTKGGVGLRLLFWRDDHGYLEFANVGPKQELKIESPSTVPE